MKTLTVIMVLEIPDNEEDSFNLDEFIDKMPIGACLLDVHETTDQEIDELTRLNYLDSQAISVYATSIP